jgi:NADPH:quinone reductase-like Zn-dependent oxidoreductase
MKAYYSKSYGNSGASVYGDLPDPVTGPGQVLVEIKAVSINPVDWKIRRGDARVVSGFRFPRIFGADFAGIVRETWPGVTAFTRGQRVYGSKSIVFDRGGALAELRAVEENKIRLIPEGMSFNDAASLPVAALTALNGLRKCGVRGSAVDPVRGETYVPDSGRNVPVSNKAYMPDSGRTNVPDSNKAYAPVSGRTGRLANGTMEVLITGGTGGVGHFAVQIAKASGARVVTTCNPANADLAARLGADETIGHSTGDLISSGRKFDAIFDVNGHMNAWRVHRLLKPGGIYASTLFIPPPYLAIAMTMILFGKKLISANIRSLDEDWCELERLFSIGSLRPVIENTFPLERASEAFDLAMRGGFRGKIIVTV